LEGVVSDAEDRGCCAEEKIGSAEKGRAPAGAVGVEEIEDALGFDVGGHGDFSRIEGGEGGADGFGLGDDTADAGGDVVGALVAEDLEGHSRHDLTLKGGVGGVLGEGFGEGGEEAAYGGAEAYAGYVDFHGLAVDGGGGFGEGFHAHGWVLGDVGG
jgi:hypothetical protein